MKEDKETNKWREVEKEEAKYGVILRAGSYDTSVYFYASKEDLEWAMNNSWFDSREAIPFQIIEHSIELK